MQPWLETVWVGGIVFAAAAYVLWHFTRPAKSPCGHACSPTPPASSQAAPLVTIGRRSPTP